MHKFLIMGISAQKLNGKLDKKAADSYVFNTLKKYENKKFDYCGIGGRWEGMLAAKKESKNVLLTESGCFEESYDFFGTYDALENNGNCGPYIIEKNEYIPVNGGLVKEIEWDFIQKFESYVHFTLLKHTWERDPRLLGAIPDNYKFKKDGLYIEYDDGDSVLAFSNGETFSNYVERNDISFGRYLSLPFAYVDLNGIWHDDDELWEDFEKGRFKGVSMPDGIENFITNEYFKKVNAFVDSLKPEDAIIVVDYHI